MNIVFDFDGTIAKSTPYHRAGWVSTLEELNLSYELDQLLPHEPNLKERFDSYGRIKKGFLKNNNIKHKLVAYFQTNDVDILVNKIMDLKESLTVSKILQESLPDTLNNTGINLIIFLQILKAENSNLGIISSSRETIINSFLYKCGILDFFDFVIGEESLTNKSGVLFDKPNPYAKEILANKNKSMEIYVGDNEIIDQEFADRCGVKFLHADYKSDFLALINKLKLLQ